MKQNLGKKIVPLCYKTEIKQNINATMWQALPMRVSRSI